MIAFIQARITSRRLPGKVLLNLSGRPILSWVVERLKYAKLVSRIVVLTSVEKDDDVVCDYCERQNIEYFRGSLTDVLLRFSDAANYYEADSFIRICADSPFIDFRIIDYAIKVFQANLEFDIVSNVKSRSFPKGQSVEVIKTSLIQNYLNIISDAFHREHVTSYFYSDSNNNNIKSIIYPRDMSFLNLSVDTLEDLVFLEKLLKKVNGSTSFSWEELISVL